MGSPENEAGLYDDETGISKINLAAKTPREVQNPFKPGVPDRTNQTSKPSKQRIALRLATYQTHSNFYIPAPENPTLPDT